MNRARMTGRLFVAGAAAILAAMLPGTSRAAVHVDASIEAEQAARMPRPEVEVWMNKEEGGVYRQGEPLRVLFRTTTDAFVLIYNIDTEGYIHLVYPYGPDDEDRVQGGVTHQVPSRHDPYELVADGPTGIEYVVAIASPFPFRNLPWYLTGGSDATRSEYDDNGDNSDDGDSGVIVGDPYIGMDRVVRRVVPPGREDDVATADTYFYIERKVDYPRYVCADCHSYGGWYDPYTDICSVVDVRIDASWARFRPLRSRVIRPRFFYMVRSSAPDRYRQWKERWSSVDGRATLRTRFQVEGQDKFRSRRQTVEQRTPQEFRDLRRPRSGKIWSAPDEVLRRRDRQQVEDRRVRPDSPDRSGVQRQRDMRNRDDFRRDNTVRNRQEEQRQIREQRQIEERQIREQRQQRDQGQVERQQRDQGQVERQQRDRGQADRQTRERRDERPPDGDRQTRERSQDRPADRGSRDDRGRGNDNGHRDNGDRGGGRGRDRNR